MKKSGKCLTLYTFVHVLFRSQLCQLLSMIILQFLTRRTSYLNMVGFFQFFLWLLVGRLSLHTPASWLVSFLSSYSTHFSAFAISLFFFSCFYIIQCCKILSFRVYLSVKTCEVFLCFVAIVRVRVYYSNCILISLFSLFYITGKCCRLLYQG